MQIQTSCLHPHVVLFLLPFGLRSAAMACQRVTDSVSYIHEINGFDICSYLDDFAGAELPEKATAQQPSDSLLK